jgi:2-methylisocitrate lyase-like PEP mutase family enzyme
MIEDQLAPKRCGHTAGKAVVPRAEALTRIRAAVDAREEGADILILARTDARGPLGIDEALERCRAFADLGADLLFPEAPLSEREMERFCRELPLPVMANMVEEGLTPVLPPARLEALGFKLAAYPLTLLAAAVRAMQQALDALRERDAAPAMVGFAELQQIVGFPEYDEELRRYADDSTSVRSSSDRAKIR